MTKWTRELQQSFFLFWLDIFRQEDVQFDPKGDPKIQPYLQECADHINATHHTSFTPAAIHLRFRHIFIQRKGHHPDLHGDYEVIRTFFPIPMEDIPSSWPNYGFIMHHLTPEVHRDVFIVFTKHFPSFRGHIYDKYRNGYYDVHIDKMTYEEHATWGQLLDTWNMCPVTRLFDLSK